jgi:hypothetical protein
MKKTISLLLTLMLCASLAAAPAAYAADSGAPVQQPDTADYAPAAEAPDRSAQEQDVLAAEPPAADAPALSAAEDAFAITAAQEKINYRTIVISIPELDALKADNRADAVTVTAKMYWEKEERQSASVTKQLSELSDAAKTLTLEVPAFGKWMVSAAYTQGEDTVQTTEEQAVGVVAERYNIAPITSTTPVLIYSMKMLYDKGLNQTESGDPVPSILCLNRPDQYDWEKLPENVYANPLLTKSQNGKAYGANKWQSIKIARMKDYVNELYALNPSSKFVFIVNDWMCRITLPQLVYLSDLPEDSYSLILVTDGSATYNLFRTVYGNTENAQAKHDMLVASFKKFRDEVRKDPNYGYDLEAPKNGYSNVPCEDGQVRILRELAYAIVDVEDAQWWVVRKSKDTFEIEDEDFMKKVIADTRISNNYLNGLLSNVQAAGKEDIFRALYKFDDTAFQATRAKKKKIMMILGTAKAVENENPVDQFVNFTQAYYGDQFEYYYKGHPGWIIEGDKERLAHMAELNLQTLDSSIAAELFGFYNPDIYLSGYTSTTFQSIGSAETNGGLYNITKDAAYNTSKLEYAEKMDFFMTDMETTPPSEEILALRPNPAHQNYLVEFNKTPEDTDIAIWDADIPFIYFFSKGEDGTYRQTDKKDCRAEQVITVKDVTKTLGDKAFKLNAKNSGDGKLSYASSNEKVAVISASGKVSIKGVGKTTITVKAAATNKYQSAKVKIKLTVKKPVPKVPTKLKLSNPKGRKITAKWKAVSKVNGYQVRYSTDKKMKKSVKTVSAKAAKSPSATIKNLKQKKTYYVQVRSYKTVNKTKYYSDWSSKAHILIKK